MSLSTFQIVNNCIGLCLNRKKILKEQQVLELKETDEMVKLLKL